MAVQVATIETTPASDAAMPRRLAVGALTFGTAYVVWRVGTLGTGARLALSVPLLLVEVWSLLDLAAFALRAWRLEEDVAPPADQTARADVVVDASSGGADDLERTLIAVEALGGVATLTVVESRARRDIVATAGAFGARVQIVDPVEEPVSLITPSGECDVWLWLAAGQVPLPDVIHSVAPRFREPEVAVCQVAVDLLNADSLVHLRGGRDDDAITRTVVGPATSRIGLAPWIGPGSFVRRSALDDVGGFIGESKDAPLRTAVRLHAAGWTTKWEQRPLVRENAPETLQDYLARRHDQAAATLRLLRSPENPLWVTGLAPRARWVHLSAGMSYGRGLRLATAAMILIAVLLSGTMPFDSTTAEMLLRGGGFAAVAVLARRSLARGTMVLGDGVRNAWRTLEADAQAFEVEEYQPRHEYRAVDRRAGLRLLGRLRVVTAITIALQIAVIAQGASALTTDVLPALSFTDQLVAIALVVGLTVPLIDVLQVVVRRQQRRRYSRLPAALDIDLDGSGARTVDLSPKGVGVIMDHAPATGSNLPFRLALPRSDGSTDWVEGIAAVRAASSDPSGRVRVGLEFLGQNRSARVALIRYCAIDHAVLHSHTNGEHNPEGLSVVRGHRSQRSLQVLIAVCAAAAVITLLANPSSAQQSMPNVVESVCTTTAAGDALVGVPIALASTEQIELGAAIIGTTGADGCVASSFDPLVTVVWAGHDGSSTSKSDRYDGSSMVFAAERLAVQVLGPDGRGVPAVEVRGYGIEWDVLGTTDADGTLYYESLGRPVSVDASWDAVRVVADVDEAVVRLRASAIDDDPANPVEAVSADVGWVPFRAGDPISAGRTAFRLADGTVLRAEIGVGIRLDLLTGAVRSIEPVSAAPRVDEPASTAVDAPSTSTTAATASTTTTFGPPSTTTPAGTSSTTSTTSTMASSVAPTTTQAPTDTTASTTTQPPTSTVSSATTSAPGAGPTTSDPAGVDTDDDQ